MEMYNLVEIKAAEKYNENRYQFDNVNKYEFELESFHPKESMMIKSNDDYLFGIRADHHVLIAGWNEGTGNDSFVVLGNHKGTLMIVYFEICSNRYRDDIGL